jgi:hypothetical protein
MIHRHLLGIHFSCFYLSILFHSFFYFILFFPVRTIAKLEKQHKEKAKEITSKPIKMVTLGQAPKKDDKEKEITASKKKSKKEDEIKPKENKKSERCFFFFWKYFFFIFVYSLFWLSEIGGISLVTLDKPASSENLGKGSVGGDLFSALDKIVTGEQTTLEPKEKKRKLNSRLG